MNEILADRILYEKIYIIVRQSIDFFAQGVIIGIYRKQKEEYPCQDRHDVVEFVEYQRLMHSVLSETDALSQSC